MANSILIHNSLNGVVHLRLPQRIKEVMVMKIIVKMNLIPDMFAEYLLDQYIQYYVQGKECVHFVSVVKVWMIRVITLV